MIRRTPIETKINHERWLISYADFITLLFGFFVVMYSISHVNEGKYKVLSSSLESTFSSQASEYQETSTDNQIEDVIISENLAELSELAEQLTQSLSSLIDDSSINMSANEEWLEITLNANILFSTGKAELGNEAKKILISVADILEPYDNAIAIGGHTDNLPIRNQNFQDNWALSSARAVSVVNLMSFQGIRPDRLSAVGYGEYRPIVSNDNAQGRNRNRRVVLRVGRSVAPESSTSLGDYEDYIGSQEMGLQAASSSIGETGSIDEETSTLAEPITSPGAVQPVRLRGGGLLFSRDPDLPRNNPPVKTETP